MNLEDLSIKSYSGSLVLLSCAVAILSAYSSLNMLGYANLYTGRPAQKWWRMGSAIAMGIGIWTMHFIGMLAMRSPFPLSYRVMPTLLSLLLAICASFFSMLLVRRSSLSIHSFLAAGMLMGCGIAAMHYVGMAAIDSPYVVQYRLLPFACSILIAIGISYLALYVTIRMQTHASAINTPYWKLCGAVLLGVAVTSMHYTGMYATHFLSSDSALVHSAHSRHFVPELFALTLAPGMLSILISIAVAILVILLLIGAYIDRMLAIETAQLTTVQFKALFNNNPDMILAFDEKGQLKNVNSSVLESTGYSASELLYCPGIAYRIFRSLYSEPQWAELMRSEEPHQQETSVLHKDGTVVELSVTTIPMKVRERIVGVTAIARNITDRKRDEELLRRSDKLNIAGHLAAGVAHEIRNPLTAIKGFVQLSQDNRLHTDFREIILTEIDQIERIITEFLLLAKPQTSTYHRTALQPLLEHVLTLVQAQANLSNIAVTAEYGVDLPDIYADANKLKQVFVNLLKNAVESMLQGGTIHIQADVRADRNVTVRIEDEGVGISEELRRKLGEPFYSTKEKGTGLGLMVSFQIISEHRGQIEFQQASGGGTVVEVTLPVMPPEEAQEM